MKWSESGRSCRTAALTMQETVTTVHCSPGSLGSAPGGGRALSGHSSYGGRNASKLAECVSVSNTDLAVDNSILMCLESKTLS